MRWSDLRLSVLMACVCAGGVFALFFAAFFGAALGAFSLSAVANLIVFRLPLRLLGFFGWEQLAGWKLYIAGFVFVPLYYGMIGYLLGLGIERVQEKRKE